MTGEARVALVTGANHGIGAAATARLARAGHKVLASYLRCADEPGGMPSEYFRARLAAPEEMVAQVC